MKKMKGICYLMFAIMLLLAAAAVCADTTTTTSKTVTTITTTTTVGFTTITLGSTTTSVALGLATIPLGATTTTPAISTTTTTYDPNAPPFIDANIPEKYNSVTIDITVRTKPLSSLYLYVNEQLQRQKVVGNTGEFTFTDIMLLANTGNKIKIQATDAMQQATTQEYAIFVDAVPPTVVMKELPAYILTNSLVLNGTVSEDVTFTVMLSYKGQAEYLGVTSNLKQGAFNQPVSLTKGEGDYVVRLVFNDTGGNEVVKSGTVKLDAVPPQLTLEPALAQLSPSYTDKVRISGKTDPGSRVIVFVNGKTTMESSYSTAIVSILEKIGRLVKGEIEYSTTADSEGKFSIDVVLTQEVSVRSEDSVTIKRPSGSGYVEEVRYSTGNQWKNKVEIVAIDDIGRQSAVLSGEILYAYCGVGGDWNIQLENPSPSVLQPILLKDGKASIGFNYRLKWQGPGSDTQAKVVNMPVIRAFTQLSGQEAAQYDNKLIPSGRIFTQFNRQANVGSTSINLLQWSGSEKELTDKKSLKFFLEMDIDYSFDYYGYPASGRQRKCIPVEIYMDQRWDQALLPEGFLKGAVDVLNTSIDVLDKVLDVVTDVRKYAFYGCLGSHAYQIYNEVSEKMACMPYLKSATPFTPPIAEGGPYDVEQLCAGAQDDDEKNNCQSCWDAKIATKKATRAMQWICDRTYCPSVPSVEEYAHQQKDKKLDVYIYFEGEKALIRKGSNCYDYALQKPTYATPKEGDTEIDACGKEYKYQWDTGCIGVDEYRKSFSETYDTNFFNKFVDTVSDVCTSGNSDQYVKAIQVKSQLTGTQQYLLVKTGTGTANDPAAGKSLKRVGQDRIDFTYDFKTDTAKKVIKENEIEVSLVDVTAMYKVGYDLFNLSRKNTGKTIPDFKEWRLNFLSTPEIPGKLQAAINDIKNQPDMSQYDQYYQCNNGIDDDKDETKDFIDANNDGTPDAGSDTDCSSKADNSEGPDRIKSTDSDPYSVGKAAAEMSCTAGSTKKDEEVNAANVECDSRKGNFNTYPQGADTALTICKERVTLTCKAIHDTPKSPVNPTEKKNKENLDQEKLITEIWELVRMDVFEQMFQKKWVVDPTSGILRSAQCVCLPAFEQYITHYRNVLDATKKCFNQVLMGADTTAGFCRSVMTQYVCDLVYSAIRCVGKFAQATVNAGTETAHDDSGFSFGSFFASLASGGEGVAKSIEGRYGATTMYKAMFQEKGLMNSACVFAFGGDWNVELDQLFSRATSKMPTESMVYIFPATRRYMSTNIVSGYATYIYHIGVGLVAGADVNYRISLVCSADTTCAPEDGYANGECDCYRKGAESTRLLRAPGGLRNSELWSYDFYEEVNNAVVRYDKIRFWYEYINNQNEKVVKQHEMRISEIGGRPPVDCQFDIGSLMFVCRLNIGNKGYAKFTGPPVVPKPQYMIGDTIKLTGKITKVSPQDNPNTPMYLVAKVLDEDGKIIGGRPEGWLLTMDREYDLEKDAEFGTGIPGFTISTANFYSKGVQNKFSGNAGISAIVDGRLNSEVDVSFKKVNDKMYYRVIPPSKVEPQKCTSESTAAECEYNSGMVLTVDSARIIFSGAISTQQGSDLVKILPSTGGEANWKIDISLHYANSEDPTKYDAEPIDIEGPQTYTLAVKVIGQMSPTSGNCIANDETQKILSSSCKCNGQSCPTTVGQTGYPYCYGTCRLWPRCVPSETTEVTSPCVCVPTTPPGDSDCNTQGLEPGKTKRYCVNNKDNVPSCITK